MTRPVTPDLRVAMRRAVTAGLTQQAIADATGYTTRTIATHTRGLVPAGQAMIEERAIRRAALAGLGATLAAIGRAEGCSRQAVHASLRRDEARRARRIGEVRL